MKNRWCIIGLVLLTLALTGKSFAQNYDRKIEGGVVLGPTYGQTELDDATHFLGRSFLRYDLIRYFKGEFGIGLGRIKGQLGNRNLISTIIPIDYRVLFTLNQDAPVMHYIYGGIGVLHYSVANSDDWGGLIPAGMGLRVKASEQMALEFNGGINYTTNDAVNAVIAGSNDVYWTLMAGLSFKGENGNADPDGDGLTNNQEKELKTNKKKPDTDGDGLNDGDEYNRYLSNPLNIDSDGDNLPDGDEVRRHGTSPTKADTDGDRLRDDAEINIHKTDAKNVDTDSDNLNDGDEIEIHKTDPTRADTDGEGLNDGDEVNRYRTDPLNTDSDSDGLSDALETGQHRTDPLKPDTDGDSLNDGDEINSYQTNPISADTDGDALSDGAEVNQHQTNPLIADTDGGTVSDGVEISRGSDPRVAEDDVIIEVEAGEAIVLEGVVFESGSAELTPNSEALLRQAYNTLAQNAEVMVEIRGYTDSVGSRAFNQSLSQKRAESVRNFLMSRGISADRITAKGYGPDNPVAPNNTPEGRQQNRRIEFYRIQ